MVGSELIQKYLGDGPKLVRELFRVAEEHAPSIVFIDEIDAIGTKRYFGSFLDVLFAYNNATNYHANILLHQRYESNSGGEREIQRTMLELLNQLDGFDSRGDVKVIMATNRIDSLDPALIRPGIDYCAMTFLYCQIEYMLYYDTGDIFLRPNRPKD